MKRKNKNMEYYITQKTRNNEEKYEYLNAESININIAANNRSKLA